MDTPSFKLHFCSDCLLKDGILASRYSKEWERTVKRIGRWIDFDTGYRTMDASFMESVWWVFKQLWDKGLVYRGYKVLHFGCR